jgi:hypothetical protein
MGRHHSVGAAFAAILGGTVAISGLGGGPASATGEQHLREGDQFLYSNNFDIHVYGTNQLGFDEREGRPEDDKGQVIRVGNVSDIYITGVRYAPDGSDAWYSVTITYDWHGNHTSGWIRAADLNTKTERRHIASQQSEPKLVLNRSNFTSALEEEARVSTDAYRSQMAQRYMEVNGSPRVQTAGQLCEAQAESQSMVVALRLAPSTASQLIGFLRDHAFVRLLQHSPDGWWQVGVHLEDGSWRKGYITEWLINVCGKDTAYADTHRYALLSPAAFP